MLRLPEIIWLMLGRTGINVTTSGTLSDNFLRCRCLESLAVWSRAYFAYFLLDERVFITPVNEMCGECVARRLLKKSSVEQILVSRNAMLKGTDF